MFDRVLNTALEIHVVPFLKQKKNSVEYSN